MKFLLMVTLLVGSLVANANVDNEWKVKCFERDGSELDLAYIINVGHNMEMANRVLTLEDCTHNHGRELDNRCKPVGQLEQNQRQNESCLVLKRHRPGADLDNRSWSLCYEQQETLENPRLVPVTVTADRQASRIYCERSLLNIL
jgi:hypothetical protein